MGYTQTTSQQSSDAQMKNYEKKRASLVVRQIWALFTLHAKKSHKPKLSAKECLSQVGGSHATVIKARQALDVRSVKIAGTYRWEYPRRTLEQALVILGRNSTANLYKVRKDRRHQILPTTIKSLSEIMTSFGCDALVKHIHAECRSYGMTRAERRLLYPAKKELGIIGVWQPDGWHWLYISPTLKSWVEKMVTQQEPIPVKRLEEEAQKKGYSRLVLHRTIMVLGASVRRVIHQTQICWHDKTNMMPESMPAPDEKAMQILLEENDVHSDLHEE